MLTQELRPIKFSELVGCEEQSLLLKACISKKDRPSTYLFSGDFGSGKAQPLDLVIPTPSGDKRFGDLHVGDYVFDRHGAPTRVIGVFHRGRLESYRVTLEDGRSTLCNDDHLWTVRVNKGAETTLSTRCMRDTGLCTESGKPRYEIPNFMRGERETSYVSIVSIEKTNQTEEMMCIRVESEDGLYLTNDYIVTHNTSAARIFARGLNCSNFGRNNDVCCECSFCNSNLSTVPWYLELDASQVGNVDSIRAMQDLFYPVSAYTRVVVFDEAHLISRQAQSALLKLFEDTPVGIVFLLVTTDPENILETIKNRSLAIHFSKKKSDIIYEHVRKKFPHLREETVKKVVDDSHGIMRECHMILERINLIGEDKYNELNFSLDSYFTDYLKSLLVKDKELLFRSIDGISTRPIATVKVDYQNYLYNLVKDSFNVESLGDSLRDNIIKGLQKGNKLIQLVRLLGQDWVLASFKSQIEMSTALMAIYQQINVT